jgi:carbamoyltransferase
MRTLGFSVGHDKGAVIIEDGKVLVGITQERLSRIKHDGAHQGGILPIESINYCFDYLGITYRDIDLFIYSTTEMTDDVDSQLSKAFGVDLSNNTKFIPHHLAHAYSSFFSSGFDEAAVVVADASGSILSHLNKLPMWYKDIDKTKHSPMEDWTEGISIFHFKKQEFTEVYKKWIKYPVPLDTEDGVSVGTVYSEGSLQLIYEPNSHTWPAGKLMGLASYANQDIVNEAPFFIVEKDDDIFIPNKRIYPKVTWSSDFYSRACVAGIYQREQERASIILAEKAKKLTNSENICVAGGSFLNCNSNEKILNSGLYENCYFIPPADDSGIPLGCAWYGYQQLINIDEVETLKPYLGKTYSQKEIIASINEYPHLLIERYDDFEKLIEDVSYWLTQNRVIGWFQGGSEIGPRALGNRSILASPISSWMIGHINNDIKKREWYRPFAPAVLFEHQSDIFESDVYSPHMLVTTTVKEEWRNKIPAVTHVDNSARHQSVTENNNPKFYSLINKFYEKTGVPVLLNTSFNGPKEPIVESPVDAIKTFIEIGLDFLVLDNVLIRKKL